MITTTTLPLPQPSHAGHPRLGRVEAAILDALERSGGVIQRDEARDNAFPRLRARGRLGRPSTRREQQERARAEAAVSRAILSLERKRLLVREHSPRTGRTVLLSPDREGLPDWEETARAEEDLAAHCLRIADRWTALARRSRARAAAVRSERSVEPTEAARNADLEEMGRLQGDR
ncbi:MAG TPA: hypothetical protein VF155_07390 [Candidatus Dormibacteraeota bacterium]